MKRPNIFKTVLSVAACKFTRFFLRKTGRGGTAVPGIVAMKFSKNILARVSQGMKIVVVTGTNGKTTTCNMLHHAITSCGKKCFLNKSGANLLHGITSDLVSNATWNGKPKYPYAVLECDEAVLKMLVPLIDPAVIAVTNLFSDQVDRYGGVQNTLEEIRSGIQKSDQSVIILNADDPLSSSLALDIKNPVIFYGMDPSVGVQGNVDLADAGKCPVCGCNYSYDFNIYAHLGGYRCTKCAYKRPDPQILIRSIDEKAPDHTKIHVGSSGTVREIDLSIPAVYNIYNAAAALSCIKALDLSEDAASDSLSSVRPSFGRFESFTLGNIPMKMILVKNPAGCNQAFSYVTSLSEDFTAVLCLNDRTGDGHDISWIDSTDYEKLCTDPHLKGLYVCGDRGADLLKRVKEAGAPSDTEYVADYKLLLEELRSTEYPIFLLPNYTAMMDLRTVLHQEIGTKGFWE